MANDSIQNPKSEIEEPRFLSRFEAALVLANRLHATQTRKGTDIPYIGHLLAVTSMVIENGGNEDEMIAALLHDAVEDQGGPETREIIRQQFGESVAAIVDGCTDTDQTPKPPWRERKEKHIALLRHASPSVRLVSLADKLHNVRATLHDYRMQGEAVFDRFTGGKEGTLWYYRALMEVFREIESRLLVDELDQMVGELERSAEA